MTAENLLNAAILNDLETRLGRQRVARVVAAQLRFGQDVLVQLIPLADVMDRVLLRSLAHQVAGSSGSVGLEILGEAARRVEHAAPDGKTEDLIALVNDLITLAAASFAELARAYPEALPS